MDHYPDSIDISLAYQGLNIRCGVSESALAENKRIHQAYTNGTVNGYGDYNFSQLIELSSYRINANLGDADQLSDGNDELKWHRMFAWANSLDNTGDRISAVAIYQSLSTETMAPWSIRKSAKIRLLIPYQPPETIVPSGSLKFPECSTHG